MSGVGVIFNPNAKRYKKNPDHLKHMAFIIGERASGKPTQDMADLYAVAEEFKAKDIDILAISGGDGTIHCTLTAFLKIYADKPLPKISLLRGGTQNNVANNFKIKGDTEHLLSTLLLKYHESPDDFQEKSLRLMRFTDSNGSDVYGAIFGVGAGHTVMEYYYAMPYLNKWSAWRVPIQIGTAILFDRPLAHRLFQRIDAEVQFNGKAWGVANYSALIAATVLTLPAVDFRTFRLMTGQNESFHFIGACANPRSLLPALPSLMFGKTLPADDFVEALAVDVKMKFTVPQGYIVDGDRLPPAQEIRIQQGPLVTLLV